ncbi:MAG: ArsR family transcriptional regulator [Methanoregula sp.]|nr:ArsR family transcriptional regulator [Methanoregula sp.]
MEYKKTLTTIVLGILIALVILEYVYIPLFGMKPVNEAIPFWQPPPQAIIFHTIYLISPALMKPANFLIYWCVGFGIWMGFRQISTENVLDCRERKRIFSWIQNRPGIHYRELERETGTNCGTLSYHLEILAQTHTILTTRSSGHTRYFENDGKYSELEQKILSSLNNERKITILHVLLDAPATQAELSNFLDISNPSVAWHMKWLYHEGIVSIQKYGRQQKYCLNQESVVFLQNYFSGNSIGL